MSEERSRLSEVPALDAVGGELQSAAGRTRGVSRRGAGPGLAGAAAGLAVIAFAAFTAPGRAVAEQLGELVGIGDEPTQERLRAPGGSDYPAVVIGTGESPSGARFEIVASGPPAMRAEDAGAVCLSVEVPGFEGPEAASCLTADATAGLEETTIDPLALIAGEELAPTRLVVQGTALPQVSRVEIGYPGEDGATESVEATLGRLNAELAAGIGVERQAGYFVAFLPDDVIPADVRRAHEAAPPAGDPFVRSAESIERTKEALSRIEVVAFDAAGEEIARRSLDQGPTAHLLYPPAAPPPAFAP